MTLRRMALAAVVVVTLAAGLGWWLVSTRSGPSASEASIPAPPATPDAPGRRIVAKLFYVDDNGTRLAGVERDVPYAEGTVEQARAILLAQLAPPPAPLLSAVPPGTSLRAVFLTPRGEAYVDLSAEVSSAHTGGSLNERLTIYTFVHALTLNLPSVRAVQILVNGREVDTLAGHVDLRRPLEKDFQLTMTP